MNMERNESKLKLWAKIFLILTCAALIVGNAMSVFICCAASDETDAYDAEESDPLASLAYMGILLAGAVGCIVSAGVGNILATLFASFAVSFSSKAARMGTDAHALKIFSTLLLIVSILALIFAVPINFIFSIYLST